jgi:putative transcriptional regulator
VPWRTVLPGIREFHVPHAEKAGGEASLLWIKPGRIMPSHTHDGAEVTLVLKGGFSDASGHYRRGDIAFADSDVDHRPRADEDEDCICFAVTDAPLRLTGPFGRIVQRLFGH